jgi:hypothetical protein
MVAEKFAMARLRFPVTVIGRNAIVPRVYFRLLNPATSSDPIVDGAHRLARGAKSGVLKALLMAGVGKKPEDHLEVVAAKSGISLELVSAFEILFFNVLDRHEDGLYLSQIAYPLGRPVMFSDNYFKKTPIDDLLLRASYDTRDTDFVEYLAGLEQKAFLKALKENKRLEEQVVQRIVASAHLQLDAGLVNQRTPGIDRADGLLEPARRGRPFSPYLEPPPDFDLGAELRAFLEDASSWKPRAGSGSSACESMAAEVAASERNKVENTNGDVVDWFPMPRKGIWRNQDSDVPVVIVAVMSSPGLPDHYLTENNSGIPASEVELED